MDNLSAFDSSSWDPKLLPQHPAYISGNALAWLYLGNKQASVSYALSGRLYLTKANWLMLSVPNALVRGVFDAISAPGAELPTQSATGAPETKSGLGDVLNANIAVMTADEVAKIGADSINERGHSFGYALSGMTELAVSHLPGVSKAWALQISAPSLSALRKSYGLSPTPRDQGTFHILVAVRRKGVLSDNGQAKGYETPVEAAEGESFSNPISRGELKAAADITKLSPKWSDREHLLAALPKHLTDTQAAMSTPGGNVDKEMTDLALIARAWLKSQQQKELLAARLKKFQETAAYPSLALQPPSLTMAAAKEKLAAAMNLYSYIPSGSIEHVKKHGLLSGNELAKPENRHLLDIARPDGDADRWLKERDAKMLKSPWTNSYNGPSAFFGDIDAGKIHDKHPIKKFETTRAVIKLRELLRDYPTTKIEGSELIPFSDETYDALDEKGQNEFVNKRHHTLSLDEVKALLIRGKNPKDMWKDFKDTEGKYYASDVPHAQVVTPMGKIPSKYIEFNSAYPSLALQPPAAAILPSSKVLPQALSKGLTDEQGHASNDQVAKAAAADHLQKDARDYEEEKLTDKLARTQILKELLAAKEHSDNKRYAAKHDILARLMAKAPQDWEIDDPKPKYKGITHKPTQFRFHAPQSTISSGLKINGNVKTSGSVYAAQARDYLNFRRPIVYDNTQPLSANIANQLRIIKRRGDFALQSQRHLQASRAAADPRYRQQLALQAFHGTLPQPSLVDRAVESIDVDALMPNINSWAGQ